MRVCYVLLSPTFGMHQYTADLANRMAVAGHDVYLVTSSRYPQDRYAPEVRLHAVVDTQDRGLSLRAIQPGRWGGWRRRARPPSDVMHITGPHLWNLAVMRAARAERPVVHTIHDFAPIPGPATAAPAVVGTRRPAGAGTMPSCMPMLLRDCSSQATPK